MKPALEKRGRYLNTLGTTTQRKDASQVIYHTSFRWQWHGRIKPLSPAYSEVPLSCLTLGRLAWKCNLHRFSRIVGCCENCRPTHLSVLAIAARVRCFKRSPKVPQQPTVIKHILFASRLPAGLVSKHEHHPTSNFAIGPNRMVKARILLPKTNRTKLIDKMI